MIILGIIPILIVLLLVFVLSVKIVPESREYIVETLGKYSKNPLRQSFSELGAKLGTLEELVSETNQNRKQYALLFPAQEVKIPLCAYLLTRISPLI